MRNGVTTIVPILYFFFAWMLPNSLVQIILLSTASKLAAMFCFFALILLQQKILFQVTRRILNMKVGTDLTSSIIRLAYESFALNLIVLCTYTASFSCIFTLTQIRQTKRCIISKKYHLQYTCQLILQDSYCENIWRQILPNSRLQ